MEQDNMLNEFTQLWGDTEAAEEMGSENVSDGKYEAVLENPSVDLTTSPVKVSFEYKITEAMDSQNSKFVGRKLWQNFKVDKTSLPFLKRNLIKFGISPDAIKSYESLGDSLATLINSKVVLYCKNKPSKDNPTKYFTTAYLNDVVGKGDLPF